MIDSSVESRLRRLPAEAVPPAPWLEDRVMAVLTRSNSTFKGPNARLVLAAVAAAVVGALVVGALVGSRLGAAPSPNTRVTPSRDAGIVAYRQVVDDDLRVVDHAMAAHCPTRTNCLVSMEEARTATLQLWSDTFEANAPQGVRPTAAAIHEAAARYIHELDTAIALTKQPGSDFIVDSAIPDIGPLYMAVVQLDCWPVQPVEGGHGASCQ